MLWIIMQLSLIGLKITECVDWSWAVILLPMIIVMAITCATWFLVIAFGLKTISIIKKLK